MNSIVNEKIDRFRKEIKNIFRSYAFRHPEDIIHQNVMRIDELAHRLYLSAGNCIVGNKENISKLQHQIESLNPENVLNRGYSMLFKEDKLISSINAVEIKDIVSMKLKDGHLDSTIIGKFHD